MIKAQKHEETVFLGNTQLALLDFQCKEGEGGGDNQRG